MKQSSETIITMSIQCCNHSYCDKMEVIDIDGKTLTERSDTKRTQKFRNFGLYKPTYTVIKTVHKKDGCGNPSHIYTLFLS
jgi:hypothetical protein